jgi:hypothetical protein
MIPKVDIDPNINIIVIGAYILKKIKFANSISLNNLIEESSYELSLSIDHIILAIDWLYIINSISINASTMEIYLNEAK